MPVNHPDIRQFITVKSDLEKLTKANLSVKITDDFMQRLLKNENYTLEFTRENGETISEEIKASEIFDLIVKNNYDYGEPGVIFWDTARNWSMISENPEYVIESANPCGEQMLPAYGACCLGSFNLVEYLYSEDGYWKFDFIEFSNDIDIAVRAMNDILDEGLELHPLQEQKELAKRFRQIGIGIMGLADMFMKLGIRYGSSESLKISEQIASTLLNTAALSSANLAKEYGPYPDYNNIDVEASDFFRKNINYSTRKEIYTFGLRNACLLSIAPTGTLSTMLGVSGGIEPIFAKYYERKTESLYGEPVTYKVFPPIIKEIMQELKLDEDDQLPDYIVSSADIPVNDRLSMQAAWQKYIDSSISSTVNLPNTATLEDIKQLYIAAWKMKLKGVTVFRSGCKKEGILTEETKMSTEVSDETLTKKFPDFPAVFEYIDSQLQGDFEEYYKTITSGLERGQWKPIAPDTVYHPVSIKIGCGKLKLFIGYSEREKSLQDFELRISGSGGCERSLQDLVIVMSGIIRLGGTIDNIEKAFRGVRGCNSFITQRAKGKELSAGDNCGKALLLAIRNFCDRMDEKEAVLAKYPHIKITNHGFSDQEGKKYGLPVVTPITLDDLKPFIKKFELQQLDKLKEKYEGQCCSNPIIIFEGGCRTCKNCGSSKCE
jgi:ribonucleoside-diphosphate reductase alpha chain